MCGRFSLAVVPESLRALFKLAREIELPPRYNIAPSQEVGAVRAAADGASELALLRWGLIPHWAKDPSIGARTINARAETLAEKPSFRTAFRKRRCLIPADGFYEWAQREGKKQPYFVQMREGEPFAMAGLWERWRRPDGNDVESCAIVTCGANGLLRPFHHRMPVILPADDFGRWLDPAENDSRTLQPLLRPYPGGAMKIHPVSVHVNNLRNDDPRCVEPMDQSGSAREAWKGQ